MSTSLKEAHIATEMAKLLYHFLPGSGSGQWTGHVSFQTVADDVGVGDFWQGGSKEPAISALLEKTLSQRRSLFEKLILTIVSEAMKYRKKNGKPITRGEIETLNGLIIEVGFKIPALWAPDYLTSLDGNLHQRAKANVDQAMAEGELRASEQSDRAKITDALKQSFYALSMETDRQAVGLAFEKLLNELFAVFDLEPRPAFRLKGEQIDGSFSLDNEIYLVEAKWHKEPLPKTVLGAFRDTVSAKSSITRGVFISVNGITEDAKDAITRGQAANFFVVDGYDLTLVMEGQVDLPDLLRWKLRRLAEEGHVFVSGKGLVHGA